MQVHLRHLRFRFKICMYLWCVGTFAMCYTLRKREGSCAIWWTSWGSLHIWAIKQAQATQLQENCKGLQLRDKFVILWQFWLTYTILWHADKFFQRKEARTIIHVTSARNPWCGFHIFIPYWLYHEHRTNPLRNNVTMNCSFTGAHVCMDPRVQD